MMRLRVLAVCGALLAAVLPAAELPQPHDLGGDLVQLSAQPDNRDRQRALLQLAKTDLPADNPARKNLLPLLTKLAADPDPVLRACVAYCYGGALFLTVKPDKAALEPLAKLFADPETFVRRHAAEAAGQLRQGLRNLPDPADAPTLALLEQSLVRALADPEESVRLAAASAFLRFHRKGLSAAATRTAQEEQAGAGSQLAAQLRDRFSAESAPLVRAELLRALRLYGFAAVAPVLPAALASDDLALRGAALECLTFASPQDGAAYAPILQKLTGADQPWAIRAKAWGAVCRVAPEWARQHIDAALRDGNPNIRAVGAAGLAHCGEAASADRLAALFADSEGQVRRAAARALLLLTERQNLTPAAVEKIAVAAAAAAQPGQFREGLWLLGMLNSQAGFPGILRFVKEEPKAGNADLAALDGAALTLWVIARSKYAPAAEDAVRVFAATSADEACRLQALNAIRALRYAPAGKTLAKKLEETKKMEMETVWVLEGRLRREALATLCEIAPPETAETLLNAILCPQPLEAEENIEPACRWLVAHLSGEAAASAATDIAAAKIGKTFSDFAKAAFAWTEARLKGGPDAPFPPLPGIYAGETFLSAFQ